MHCDLQCQRINQGCELEKFDVHEALHLRFKFFIGSTCTAHVACILIMLTFKTIAMLSVKNARNELPCKPNCVYCSISTPLNDSSKTTIKLNEDATVESRYKSSGPDIYWNPFVWKRYN